MPEIVCLFCHVEMVPGTKPASHGTCLQCLFELEGAEGVAEALADAEARLSSLALGVAPERVGTRNTVSCNRAS